MKTTGRDKPKEMLYTQHYAEKIFNTSDTLFDKYPGAYRSLVVDTNDPLNMGRIKFKCPELHDYDLQDDLCQWAVVSNSLGGKGCGSWNSPCIGDIVWIIFEKNHPYGPVCVGFADPTRVSHYPKPYVHSETLPSVKDQSTIARNDYDSAYLPKDRRPMSSGMVDRYGNMDFASSVGFFPSEHDKPSSLTGIDGAEPGKNLKPEINNPDSKFMVRSTKYGIMQLMSDQGYQWTQEFTGDFEDDYEFESNRWLYLQNLIHESSPTSDQRRYQVLTRYGHTFEMRDVGWWRTRDGEFGQSAVIGDQTLDERWIKLRTKAGMLFELCDIGFDPNEDDFVKINLVDEPGDSEDAFGDDARFIRLITRTGLKFVLDDRGASRTEASRDTLRNNQIGTGVLIKGRANPGAGDEYANANGNPVGYYWQIDERPTNNNTQWGSPLGRMAELNDRDEYVLLASCLPSIPKQWNRLGDVEFTEKSGLSENALSSSHHLFISHALEAIRLKSRSGRGQDNEGLTGVQSKAGVQQGLEIHDNEENPWLELVDVGGRGIWFSDKNELSVFRGDQDSNIYIMIDDRNKNVLVHNRNTDGKVQIVCDGDIEFYSGGSMTFQANNELNFKSGSGVSIQSSGNISTFNGGGISTQGTIRGGTFIGRFPEVPSQWVDAEGRAVRVTSRGIGNASNPSPGIPISNVNIESVRIIAPDDRLS